MLFIFRCKIKKISFVILTAALSINAYASNSDSPYFPYAPSGHSTLGDYTLTMPGCTLKLTVEKELCEKYPSNLASICTSDSKIQGNIKFTSESGCSDLGSLEVQANDFYPFGSQQPVPSQDTNKAISVYLTSKSGIENVWSYPDSTVPSTSLPFSSWSVLFPATIPISSNATYPINLTTPA